MTLRTDAMVAGVLLCMIMLLGRAGLVAVPLSHEDRARTAGREAHYRLLANNIADIVILMDARGTLRYVSHSVEPVLGLRVQELSASRASIWFIPRTGKRRWPQTHN